MSVDLVTEMQNEGARQRRNAAAIRKAMPREPKAKKAKRGSPERDAQIAVVAWLRKAGCLVNAAENERRADSKDRDKQARFQTMRQKAGITKGWPDLTVVTPDGQVCFVEMKSATGTASDAQKAMLAAMSSRGLVAVLGRDIWSVQAALYEKGIVIARTGRMQAETARAE